MTGDDTKSRSELILYQTEDGRTRIQCRFEGDTVWLTQAQMAELFQTTAQNITLHLKDIFAEGELDEEATCKSYLQVRQEGGRRVTRSLRHYHLDAEFLKTSGRRLLDHAGSVSAEDAKTKAEQEYARYHALLDAQPRAIDAAFEKVAKQLKKPATPRGRKGRNGER